MDAWSAFLALSMVAVAGALAWVLRLSSRFRHDFARHLPASTREALEAIFTGLWMLVVLFIVASAGRLSLAILGPSSSVSATLAGMATALALLTAWTLGVACRRLNKGG